MTLQEVLDVYNNYRDDYEIALSLNDNVDAAKIKPLLYVMETILHIDWMSGYEYAAMDYDGKLYLYKVEPDKPDDSKKYWKTSSSYFMNHIKNITKIDDYEDTLLKKDEQYYHFKNLKTREKRT